MRCLSAVSGQILVMNAMRVMSLQASVMSYDMIAFVALNGEAS